MIYRDPSASRLIWFKSQIQAQNEKAAREDRKRAERRKRHLMDDLRYAMKKAEPPINLDGTYDEVNRISSEAAKHEC